ncbi:hypothetical protein BJ170DRAFT_370360 [Xylariales sp. AK1849]|nr:hypothetical protein BJ170DRAFT_370360 [Xylariales sp. AK1849]
MAFLPTEVYRQVFGYTSPKTLAHCRLLNKYVGTIATEFAFRHTHLEASQVVSNFVGVAQSEKLRPFVREITIDTWIGPDFDYRANELFQPPREFIRALAFLQVFTSLKTLNLRFSKWCGNDDRARYSGYSIEEDYDFRWGVLDIIFRCLAGSWTAGLQQQQEESLVGADEDDLDISESDEDTLENDKFDCRTPNISTQGFSPSSLKPSSPIELNALTISNLADFNDERLTCSPAFKQVMSAKSLTNIKLLVATEEDDANPDRAIWLPEKHDFFDTLPETWLSPPVAQNLRELSLFVRDYWGWNPKMDFRAINSGNSLECGFPNLRVLSLGHYVFSHEWQVNWVTSLGYRNGRGGLEELYLDDCPIMWQARTLQPLDESKSIYKSANGVIELSNVGYPRKDIMTGTAANAAYNPANSHTTYAGVRSLAFGPIR